MEVYKEIERSIITKYRKLIWAPFMRAIQDYQLIQEGDKVAVCISGGKDSFLLAKCIEELSRHGKFPFQVEYLVMDPGYHPKNRKLIEENAKKLNLSIHIFETNIFESVKEIKNSPCYLCARMRRGNLYAFAKELGCNKIALGHHFDDVIETILMGMLYGGQVQTMMPKFHSTNFEGMELIRPMYLIREADIINWAKYNGLEFIACACKFTEKISVEEKENRELSSKRKKVKQLIAELKKDNTQIETNIFRSVQNVNLATIIGYKDKGGRHNFLDSYDSEKFFDEE